MPIESKHPLYNEYEPKWEKTRDACLGDDAIKSAMEKYTPRLPKQTAKSYEAMVERGVFFGASKKTVLTLTGAITRKDPILVLPPVLEELNYFVTKYGQSIFDVIRYSIDQLIKYSRIGIFVDYNKHKNQPYFSLYDTFSIINQDEVEIEGKIELSQLILHETVYEKSDSDKYELKPAEYIREYELDISTRRTVKVIYTLHKKVNGIWQVIENLENPTGIMSVNGIPLDRIPFVMITPKNAYEYSDSLIYDVVALNLAHWRLTVEQYHGLHFTAIPTPWAAGFEKSTELAIGGQLAWQSENPDAKCGYMEFSGRGLESVAKELLTLEKRIAAIGAKSLMPEEKRGVEASDTLRTRIATDTVTLSTISMSVAEGIKEAYEIASKWKRIEKPDIQVALNTEFVPIQVDAALVKALLEAVLQNKLSVDSFLYNLKRNETLPPGRTVKDEKDLIASEPTNEGFNLNA